MEFNFKNEIKNMRHFDMVKNIITIVHNNRFNIFLDTNTETFYVQPIESIVKGDWFKYKDPGVLFIYKKTPVTDISNSKLSESEVIQLISDAIAIAPVEKERKIGQSNRHPSIDEDIAYGIEHLFLSKMEWVTEFATIVKIRFENRLKVYRNKDGIILGYIDIQDDTFEKLDNGSCPIAEKWKTDTGICSKTGWGNAKYLKDNQKITELKNKYTFSDSIVCVETNPENPKETAILIYENQNALEKLQFSFFINNTSAGEVKVKQFAELLNAGSCPFKNGWMYKYEAVFNANFLKEQEHHHVHDENCNHD